jgi:uncharacterized membrane protein
MQDELAALHADLLRSALRAGSGTDCDPDSALAAWLRLPLQLPLFWLAWKVARPTKPDA